LEAAADVLVSALAGVREPALVRIGRIGECGSRPRAHLCEHEYDEQAEHDTGASPELSQGISRSRHDSSWP
jgi:hypothetical protein